MFALIKLKNTFTMEFQKRARMILWDVSAACVRSLRPIASTKTANDLDLILAELILTHEHLQSIIESLSSKA
jgi:hypothetical protein